MPHEIERKYLLNDNQWQNADIENVYEIQQGYVDADLSEVFIKLQPGGAVLTLQSKNASGRNDSNTTSLTITYNEHSNLEQITSLPQYDVQTGALSLVDNLVCRFRLRRNKNTGEAEAFLTIKAPTDNPDISNEFEEAVDADAAAAALEQFGAYNVTKARHVIPVNDGYKWEVDVFEGDLQGLVMAEIEVPHERDFDRVQPLRGLGRDVTSDHRYKNRVLGEFGLPKP